MSDEQIETRDIAPGDVAQMVHALLDGIDRGELRASRKEVSFLHSVAEMLSPTPAR